MIMKDDHHSQYTMNENRVRGQQLPLRNWRKESSHAATKPASWLGIPLKSSSKAGLHSIECQSLDTHGKTPTVRTLSQEDAGTFFNSATKLRDKSGTDVSLVTQPRMQPSVMPTRSSLWEILGDSDMVMSCMSVRVHRYLL